MGIQHSCGFVFTVSADCYLQGNEHGEHRLQKTRNGGESTRSSMRIHQHHRKRQHRSKCGNIERYFENFQKKTLLKWKLGSPSIDAQLQLNHPQTANACSLTGQ